MFSIIESLIILVILSLNFAVIIWFQNRILVVASVMITNLIIILLYSTIILDYQNLQELIIATIFYSITILVLISNSSHIDQVSSLTINKIRSSFKQQLNYSLIFLTTFAVSCAIFYLSKNIKAQPLPSENQNIEKPNQPGNSQTTVNNTTSNQQKKLQNNILFKRSTDAILIMTGAITILLLNSKYRNRESEI